MAAKLKQEARRRVVKRTAQNGSKTSTIKKAKKTVKKYRGQGR